MKNSYGSILIAGGVLVALFALSKSKTTTSPKEDTEATAGFSSNANALRSPIAEEQYANIARVYGGDFSMGVREAVEKSKNAREAFAQIAKIPVAPNTALRDSGVSETTIQSMLTQTTLKENRGGGSSLKEGTYNVNGKTVVVGAIRKGVAGAGSNAANRAKFQTSSKKKSAHRK